MQIAVIGAGAAGCFTAIRLKRRLPQAGVTIYESGRKALAKVAVTGGGRCNLTNSFGGVRSLTAVYPRGERLMRRLLREFGHADTCQWFESEGVRLVTQDDGCVFPRSQDAMEIVGTLTRLMRREGVEVRTGHRVSLIERSAEDGGNSAGFRISFDGGEQEQVWADTVLVTTGGCQKRGAADFLRLLDVNIAAPVPSLFSLCLPDDDITDMTGTVVRNVTVGLAGTGLRADGPLLITHWGMSGPAILKLSSYAARVLDGNGYKGTLCVNWLGGGVAEAADLLAALADGNQQKQLSSVYPPQLNARLWACLLRRSGLDTGRRWGELGRKGMGRLANELTNSQYRVGGKYRFKEEFVTCGGVALDSINPSTLECRTAPGLYFAGEVLDVDAITGGFNLQAAWTTGYVAAESIAESINRHNNDK